MRPVVVVVLGLVLGACGSDGAQVVVVAAPTGTTEATATTESSPASTTTEPVPSETATRTPMASGRITIAAVGDVMLARSIGQRILDGEAGTLLADVAPVLSAADIAVANLETAVSDIGAPQAKGYTFRSPPEAIEALVAVGIDVVALANNHALDYGTAALLDTAAQLDAAGIARAGAGENESEARRAALVERNGLSIAFLSYVDTQAEGSYSQAAWDASSDRPGVAWASIAEIREDVAVATASADVVVVLLHFGIEYATAPTEGQRAYAQAAIDAGALLVLGSHSHVLQPVEPYAAGLIAYSLGNFVFDGFEGTSNDTAILLVTIEAGAIQEWKLVQARIVDGIPELVD